MTRWQRRARLLVALFAVGFAVLLVFAFKRRAPVAVSVSTGRTDPNAIVESTSGQSFKFNRAREDVRIEYDKQLTYKDGSTRLIGVKVITTERGGTRTFTVSAKEGLVGQNESAITMNGDVHFAASDGLTAKTEHATYSESDGMVRAPGPVEFTRRRLSGTGIGMTYDKNLDVLVILDQAHIQMPAGEGGTSTEITAPTATLARRDKYVRFERGIKAMRGGRIIEADTSVAHLVGDEDERLDSVELRGHSSITSSAAQPGGLQSLTGRDMDLKYGPDGETLEHATITSDATLQLAGAKGSSGRQITASVMDVTLAPDGTTPVGLTGREAVQLTFPAEQGAAARTIKATTLDARGDPKRGLTSAKFTGAATPACLDRRTAGPDCDVDYRERDGNVGRAAKSGSLDVTLKAGMSSIEEANFTRNVRFEEGKLGAVAAVARYVLEGGTLELTGSDPAAPRPHIDNEQIAIDASRIDVVLAGPKMKASGDVRSVLQLKSKDQKSDTKTPSMLKSDQPVRILAEDLDYDGGQSKAVYTGNAKLWQADTTVQGQMLTLDNKSGDIAATGSVTTTAMLDQRDKERKKKERVRSIGTAKEFQYEESMRRATYSGEAHLSGPQGDMTAEKIELYLQPSGNEVDRAEAYDKLTLREQKRKTTGARLTYTTADDTYVITGTPVTIADDCGGETVGRKVTFLAGTDTVIIDSGGQGRTQTKSTGKC
jgi:LPS export ABC transporter protein LptC